MHVVSAHLHTRIRRVRWVVGVAPLLLAGCYTYTPLVTLTPTEAQVALTLTDRGRADAATSLGSGIDRVEGKLLSASDTAYVLAVLRVRDIRGVETKWTGEQATIPRAWVANAYERHISRSRTYLVASAFTAAVAAFIASRTLGGGAPTLQTPGGGGGGGQQ
jgi:hypothetical protein